MLIRARLGGTVWHVLLEHERSERVVVIDDGSTTATPAKEEEEEEEEEVDRTELNRTDLGLSWDASASAPKRKNMRSIPPCSRSLRCAGLISPSTKIRRCVE
jgi:hypothetical protein